MGRVHQILKDLKEGAITVEEAETALKLEPYEDLGFAKVDHHRKLIQGVPEVIYGASKTPKQILEIAKSLKNNGNEIILITRLDSQAYEEIKTDLEISYDEMSKIGIVGKLPDKRVGSILVACAGTSDYPVAEEAAITATALGNNVTRLYDVGVSGLHRLLSHAEEIVTARCIIVVAGMEGALASVIGGLADVPVIAVPTSVGYGASFGGLAALLSMLNSCAAGVSVVNIDNGFGAGYIASMINQL